MTSASGVFATTTVIGRDTNRYRGPLGCRRLKHGGYHGPLGRMPLRQHPCAPAALEAAGREFGTNLHLLILPKPRPPNDLGYHGSAEVSADDWSLVELYRFGTRAADFIICRRCGVFIAVISDLETAPRAVVNVNCLDDRTRFTAPATLHEFQGETLEARTSRRAVNWMPAVVRTSIAYL